MFKYHLYLSTKRTNHKGLAPVYAKITLSTKIYERSSGVFVIPGTWNKDFKRISPSAPNAIEINALIGQFETKLNELKTTNYNIDEIDHALNPNNTINKQAPSFLKVLDEYMSSQETLIDKPEGITYSTYKTYVHRRKNFEKFFTGTGCLNLKITDFNAKIGDAFKQWMYQNNFSKGHINKHLKLAKTIIKYASYEYNLQPSNFMLTQIKQGQPKDIIYLTIEEIYKIQSHVYCSELLQKAADIFLLQCFTGMAYADVVRLNNGLIEVRDGRRFIRYFRFKTKNEGIVPLHPQVISILHKNQGKAPILCNQLYNRMLKEIAAVAGINKHLTSHVGRKTFATMQINAGISAEAVTKMLGKTNVQETTKLYANINHELIFSQGVQHSVFSQQSLMF